MLGDRDCPDNPLTADRVCHDNTLATIVCFETDLSLECLATVVISETSYWQLFGD